MEIAVFGASGFVGRNLVEELSTVGHHILACDIEDPSFDFPGVEYRSVDIRDEEAVRDIMSDADSVAHLAAHPLSASTDHPKMNAEINVIGTLNLLDAAREYNVEKVVFSSASSLVGEVQEGPVSEGHPAAPQSPYGVAKHAVEEYLEVYNRLYDLDYLVFRFFNVYGPHQYPESGALVPVVLSRLARGEGVFVTGDGEQTRDFVFVRDIARFICEGLETNVRNEIVNLGRGTQTSILDAITLMADVVGVDPEVDRHPPRPDEIDDFYADTTKCESLFGRTPETEFRDGIEETFDWMTRELDF